MSAADIGSLEALVQGTRRPDLTLLLDLPVDLGLARSRRRDAGKTRDRFERERAEFFERVRSGYLARAQAEPQRLAMIDAGRSVEEVGAQILAALEARAWIS
jgi:dTMP kinase